MSHTPTHYTFDFTPDDGLAACALARAANTESMAFQRAETRIGTLAREIRAARRQAREAYGKAWSLFLSAKQAAEMHRTLGDPPASERGDLYMQAVLCDPSDLEMEPPA